MATVGTVTYPTDTTAECVVTGLAAGMTSFLISSPETGESLTLEVDSAAVSHALRVEAGGTPVYATVYPGAPAAGATVTATAGGISIRATRTVPAASATSSAGQIRASATGSLQAASVVASAGSIRVLGIGHILRVVAGGAPVYALVIPGAPATAATASAHAGAIAIGAQLPVPASTATTSAAGIAFLTGLRLPHADAMTSAGLISYTPPSTVVVTTTLWTINGRAVRLGLMGEAVRPGILPDPVPLGLSKRSASTRHVSSGAFPITDAVFPFTFPFKLR